MEDLSQTMSAAVGEMNGSAMQPGQNDAEHQQQLHDEPFWGQPDTKSRKTQEGKLPDLSVETLSTERRDELASKNLRFSFQTEEKFLKLYTTLSQRAGWKYYGSLKYIPPDVDHESISGANDDNLMTAIEIAEHLDYFSLAGDLVSNLQQPRNAKGSKKPIPRLAAGQEERWRKLRDDVIFHYYLSQLRKESSKEIADRSNGDVDAYGAGREAKNSGNGETKSRRRQPARASRSTNKNASITTIDAGAEMHFNKQSIKAKQTRKKQAKVSHSDEEISPFERLSLEACIEMVDDFPEDEVKEYESAYIDQFDDWQFLLSTNHSLLLYGYGSKTNLLNTFVEEQLSYEGYALILNGFDPEITAEGVLDLIVQMFLDGQEPPPVALPLPGHEDEDVLKIPARRKDPKTGKVKEVTMKKIRDPVERAKAIGRAIAKTQTKELYPIFLVIHNLEGMGFRNRMAQEILANLVANCKVKHNGINALRLVASIDHVDAPALLWTVSTSAKYGWLWKEVHTYRPYTEELVMLSKDEISTSNSKKRRSSATSSKGKHAYMVNGAGADRVMEVLRNLAARYTEVIQILASLQLDAQESSPNQQIKWIDASLLLQQCLNKCTVKCDSQLRTFLNELEDHELVVMQKQGSTSVMVRIPYSDDKLHEILAYRPFKN
jgi:origin recognition complex subunit 2